MTLPGTHQSLNCRNVLALDGGGVRGLSSLLILKDLMMHVNTAIQEDNPDANDLNPYDIFDLVTGTSTGGLIAIMIGKLGMTLEECIQAYYRLSRKVFGKKQSMGKLTRGFAREKWSKYSSRALENCINTILREKGFVERTPMISTDESKDSTACAVVCKERIIGSSLRACKQNAVLICNRACDETIECLVSEAARATSAAPTYFPPQTIGERRFVDGAIGYNNPSLVTYLHYTQWNRVARSRGRSLVAGAGSPDRRHGGVDWSMLRLVNLGTGDQSEAEQPLQRDGRKHRKNRWMLLKELKGIAFNTSDVEAIMELLASKDANLTYERFNAGNELSIIRMDNHKALDEIKRLTEAYLGESETQENLKRVAEEIASEYVRRHEVLDPVPAKSVTDTAPIVNPASPLEAILTVDTTLLVNTTPPINTVPVNNVSSPSSVVPAVGVPTTGDIAPALDAGFSVNTEPAIHVSTAANSNPRLIEIPSSSPLPDLVPSSGLATGPSPSTMSSANPRTPTSSSPLIERLKYRIISPFQSKSKNRSNGNNESYPTQTVSTDPSASAVPQDTEEEPHYPNTRRQLFPKKLRGKDRAETSRGSQEISF